MSTVPAEPAGAVAVTELALLTVNVEAAVAPNLTALAPVKLVPVIVREVPPAVEPVLGLTLVTVGARGSALISTPMPEDVPAGDWVRAGDPARDRWGLWAARLASLGGT